MVTFSRRDNRVIIEWSYKNKFTCKVSPFLSPQNHFPQKMLSEYFLDLIIRQCWNRTTFFFNSKSPFLAKPIDSRNCFFSRLSSSQNFTNVGVSFNRQAAKTNSRIFHYLIKIIITSQRWVWAYMRCGISEKIKSPSLLLQIFYLKKSKN